MIMVALHGPGARDPQKRVLITRAAQRAQLFTRNFFFLCYGNHRDLHSFPARRSSDLAPSLVRYRAGDYRISASGETNRTNRRARSEEHTSELQSRFDLVCRLLLEK